METGNQSVGRAAAILGAFTRGHPALRVSDVAAAVGLGLSTTSRMLATLEALELVQRDPVSQLYELGPAVLSMAGVALNNDPIYRQARPVAQRLAWELGLAANVAVRRDAELFYLLNVEGQLAQKSFTMLGRRSPLHATAMGKCLLLGVPRADLAGLLGELATYTPHTIDGIGRLSAELDQVEARGWATEVEELALGRACVAAPVRDRSGDVVAALSVSGALSTLALAERANTLGHVMLEAADQVSVGLGYLAPVGAS